MMQQTVVKRIFDCTIATLLFLLTLPLMLVTAVLVGILLGRPVLFVQKRPGRDGVTFKLIKFRTMLDLRDRNGCPLADKDRLTWFGRLLRSSSLDELPELFNVIKGDMSLVGPRPLLMEYLPLYNKEQNRRHEVRPGITGWAQVNGRNSVDWEERLAMDVWYVDNQSLWLDLKILFMTVGQVFSRQGVSQAGHVTMEKFTGTGDNGKQ